YERRTAHQSHLTDCGQGGLPMTACSLALPHEFQLVTACAMWPPSDRRTEAIRIAAVGPIDWDRLVRVAKRHQVVGLVHDGLTRARVDLPFQFARAIGAQASTLTRENLATAREALRLQRLFNEENLTALFIKGAALAVLAFGNVGLRSGDDIDLLVPYERLPAATAIIMAAGYRRFDPPPDIYDAKLQVLMPLRKDLGFVHEVTRQRIELHWRLFLNPYAMAKTSSSASRLVPISGKEGLYTLGESDLFAYLCMHGALHSWNRIKWI